MAETERNLRLRIQYDGTAYAGWQRQKGAASVQQTIEEALEPVNGAPLRLRAAGRTDAGVHAQEQVANFRTFSSRDPGEFRRAANARLPDDIAVLSVDEAPAGFESRRDARLRWYRYRIQTGPIRPVFDRRFVWHVRHTLDPALAQRAAALFAGRHDFAGYRGAACTATRTVLDMQECRLEADGPRWQVDLRCRSFLQNMVRILVGGIVEVARGKLEIEVLREALDSAKRNPRILTAPPQGLTLMCVYYEDGRD